MQIQELIKLFEKWCDTKVDSYNYLFVTDKDFDWEIIDSDKNITLKHGKTEQKLITFLKKGVE